MLQDRYFAAVSFFWLKIYCMKVKKYLLRIIEGK